MAAGVTPWQTVGPFFHFALLDEEGDAIVSPDAPDAIALEGKVLDGDGEPVPDAMLEVWQADPDGEFARPDDEGGFRGFGRVGTDENGEYRFRTVKPGRVPDRDGALQAPHLDVSIFARGLLRRLVTRIYFGDEEEANASDPLLASIADPEARSTLIAQRSGAGYRFDLTLQGDEETQFLEL